jgi:hypothetical protein
MGKGKKDSSDEEDDKKHKKKHKKSKKHSSDKHTIVGHIKHRREAIQRSAKDMRRAAQIQYHFTPGDPLGRTDPFRLEVDGSSFITPADASNIALYKEARRQRVDLEKAKVHAQAMGDVFDIQREAELTAAKVRHKDAFNKFSNAEKAEILRRETEEQINFNKNVAKERQRAAEMRELNRARREAREDWAHMRRTHPLIRQAEDAQSFARDIERSVQRHQEFGTRAQAVADSTLNLQDHIARTQAYAEAKHMDDGVPITTLVRPFSWHPEFHTEAVDGFNVHTGDLNGVEGRPGFFGTDPPSWKYEVERDHGSVNVRRLDNPPPPIDRSGWPQRLGQGTQRPAEWGPEEPPDDSQKPNMWGVVPGAPWYPPPPKFSYANMGWGQSSEPPRSYQTATARLVPPPPGFSRTASWIPKKGAMTMETNGWEPSGIPAEEGAEPVAEPVAEVAPLAEVVRHPDEPLFPERMEAFHYDDPNSPLLEEDLRARRMAAKKQELKDLAAEANAEYDRKKGSSPVVMFDDPPERPPVAAPRKKYWEVEADMRREYEARVKRKEDEAKKKEQEEKEEKKKRDNWAFQREMRNRKAMIDAYPPV